MDNKQVLNVKQILTIREAYEYLRKELQGNFKLNDVYSITRMNIVNSELIGKSIVIDKSELDKLINYIKTLKS